MLADSVHSLSAGKRPGALCLLLQECIPMDVPETHYGYGPEKHYPYGGYGSDGYHGYYDEYGSWAYYNAYGFYYDCYGSYHDGYYGVYHDIYGSYYDEYGNYHNNLYEGGYAAPYGNGSYPDVFYNSTYPVKSYNGSIYGLSGNSSYYGNYYGNYSGYYGDSYSNYSNNHYSPYSSYYLQVDPLLRAAEAVQEWFKFLGGMGRAPMVLSSGPGCPPSILMSSVNSSSASAFPGGPADLCSTDGIMGSSSIPGMLDQATIGKCITLQAFEHPESDNGRPWFPCSCLCFLLLVTCTVLSA